MMGSENLEKTTTKKDGDDVAEEFGAATPPLDEGETDSEKKVTGEEEDGTITTAQGVGGKKEDAENFGETISDEKECITKDEDGDNFDEKIPAKAGGRGGTSNLSDKMMDSDFAENMGSFPDEPATSFGAEEMSVTRPNVENVDISDLAMAEKKKFEEKKKTSPVRKGKRIATKIAFAAEEVGVTTASEPSSTASLKSKKKSPPGGSESGKKLAHIPGRPAPVPSRKHGEKKCRSLMNLTPRNRKQAVALAHAPPSVHVHPEEEEEEEGKQEIVPDQRPGATIIRGLGWDGNEDDNNYSFYQSEILVGNKPASNNEYLVEAHAVEDPVLVEARADTFIRRNRWWIVGGGILLALVIIAVVTLSLVDLSGPDAPTEAPTTIQEGIEAKIKVLIISTVPESEAALSNEKTPQHQALQWIVDKVDSNDDEWYTDERVLSQYSLATLYLGTSSIVDGDNDSSSWFERDGWMSAANECDWYGVSCDENNSIIALDLTGNNLKGTIPAEIGLLSALSSLNLDNNFLSGFIPPELFKPSKLSVLSLAQNALTGSISSSVGQSTDLTLLNLSNNSLFSVIPPEIGDLRSLIKLELAYNELIGSIPSEIGYLTMLEELDVRNNTISHKLPTEMGNLLLLEQLNLQNNDLLGPLPSEMGLMSSLRIWNMSNNHVFDQKPKPLWQGSSLKNLESLDLSYNLLTGESSDDFFQFGESWDQLTSLRLGNNFFRGYSIGMHSLPVRISRQLKRLAELDLSNSFFEGKVPDELFGITSLKVLNLGNSGMKFEDKSRDLLYQITDKLTSLEKLDLSNCAIQGQIPATIRFLNKLDSLRLDRNPLIGAIPTQIGNLVQLKELSIVDNELSGTIPTEFGNLVQLQTLNLVDNDLTGPVPSEFGQLAQLENLDLVNIALKGTIPTEIGNLFQLKRLNLEGNKLIGTMPSQIGRLNELEELFLSFNLLTGAMPSEIGFLTQLKHMMLSYQCRPNGFSETIPFQIVNLVQLESLGLNGNKLTGTIPSQIGRLDKLEHLNLHYNNLKGAIPSEMGGLTQLKFLSLYTNYLSGTIPYQIGNLSLLQTLYLSVKSATETNELTGVIPSQIGMLDKLELLYLQSNDLAGAIPSEIGSLTQLKELRLQSNGLTGAIPSEIGHLIQLKDLYLNSNELERTVPTEIGTLTKLKELELHDNSLSGQIPFSFCEMDQKPFIRVDCDDVVCHCCRSPRCTQYTTPSSSLFPSITPSTSQYPTNLPTFLASASPSISQLPTMTQNPSFRPSIFESSSPSRMPSSSPAPTPENLIITIEIELKTFPIYTGWNITDATDSTNTIHEVQFGTYTNWGETVYERVSVVLGLPYTFYLLDRIGDGHNGRIVIYLGDTPDEQRILGHYTPSDTKFSVYKIPFLASEEGIIMEVPSIIIPP